MQYNDLAQALANADACDRLFLDLKDGDAVPAEVGKLTKLVDLYVTGKRNLPYQIPPEVVSLPELRIFAPGGTYTTFPPEILEMKNLEALKFTHSCTFELPEALTGLTKLRKLDLAGMNLGTVPDLITRLPALRELNLEHCQIVSIPDTLTRLANLETLLIDGTGEPSWGGAPALFALPKLRELRIRHGLAGLPEDVGRASQLEVLALWNNGIERIPASIAKLTKLRELELFGQNLTELPDEIGALAMLEKLSVQGAHIRALPATIGKLTKLRELNVENNPIEAVPPEIGNLAELTKLDLSKTRVATLPSEIGKLTKLDVLAINYTKTLASLPDSFGDLASLRCCWLRDNKLSKLPDTLGRLGNLEVLAVNENVLTSVPDSLANCGVLRTIELTGNTFSAAETARVKAIVAKLTSRPGHYVSVEMPREAGPSIEVPTTADPRPLAPEVVEQIERLGGKLGDDLGSETRGLALGKWPLPMAMRQWWRVAFPQASLFRGTIMKHYGAKIIEIPRGAELEDYECSHHAPYDCIGYEDTQGYLVVNLRDPVISNPSVYRLDSHDYSEHHPLRTGLTLAQLLGKLRPVPGAETRALLSNVWSTTGDARVEAARQIAKLPPKKLRDFEAMSRLVWLLGATEPEAVDAALIGLSKLGGDAAEALPQLEKLGTPQAAKAAMKIRGETGGAKSERSNSGRI